MRGRIRTGPRGYPGAFNKASRAMLESGGGGDFSAAMVNSILLALWAALPALAVAYARQSALAPRRRQEFMLQKSERSELKRAVELYGQVRNRLEQLREGGELGLGDAGGGADLGELVAADVCVGALACRQLTGGLVLGGARVERLSPCL